MLFVNSWRSGFVVDTIEKKDRLLIFDILRICSVFLIVAGHLAWGYTYLGESIAHIVSFLFTGGTFWFVFQTHLGMIAVYILIFVSGAVLEYNYQSVTNFSDTMRFYIKRILRIYPAYWMSLFLGIAIAPGLLNEPFSYLFLQFIGIQTITGDLLHNPINPMGWFIGVIICLYLLFPFLSMAIKKHPYVSLLVVTIISFILRLIFIYFPNHFPFGYFPERWFPLCSLFEFCLGIFVVRLSLYPKWVNKSNTIKFLSDISFYVFLTHFVLGTILDIPSNFSFYIVTVCLFSYLFYLGDNTFQKWMSNKKSVSGVK